jgi:glutaminyl-tRNA synthetase
MPTKSGHRGTLTEPGKNSPWRDRSIEENLDLFQRMRAGEFEDGATGAAGQNRHGPPQPDHARPHLVPHPQDRHHRTGDRWCIYPMYDFTHCLSDSIEGITHSLCTLEFENNRPLYDWVLDNVDAPCHPQQIEFAR